MLTMATQDHTTHHMMPSCDHYKTHVKVDIKTQRSTQQTEMMVTLVCFVWIEIMNMGIIDRA